MKTAKMEERMEQRLWSSSSAATSRKNIFPRGVGFSGDVKYLSHDCEVRSFAGNATVILLQFFFGEYFSSKSTLCDIIAGGAIVDEFMEGRICFHSIEKVFEIFYHMVLVGIRSEQVGSNYVGTVQSH